MSDTSARPAEVVSMLAETSEREHSAPLIKGNQMRVVRLTLEAGEKQRPHDPVGDVLFLCPDGEVELRLDNHTRVLAAGEMVYLKEGQSHSLEAKRASTILIVEVHQTEESMSSEPAAVADISNDDAELDPVQEASEESFPASDPPSNTPSA